MNPPRCAAPEYGLDGTQYFQGESEHLEPQNMGEFLSLPVLVGAVNLPAIVVTCVIGAIAGWLASQIMKGGSFGIVGNIVVGIVGALIFSAIFGSLHLIDMPWVNEIASGTIGAMILLFVINLVKKAT
jgi:uncharacterized membrane protein YeaQ/YmgE (transglycosylase-associated protein family)